MRILVTAGSTQVPIDRVRCISNIFKGKTGAAIARHLHSYRKGRADHKNVYVTLLTSNPELSTDRRTSFWKSVCAGGASKIRKFKTFDELAALMEQEIRSGEYDAVIHSAAVSDYKVAGVMIPRKNGLKPVDASKKVSGSHPVMYLKMVPTIKLVDQIREPWGFKGKLVKFKLQVGISDEALIEIARKSLVVSKADFIVANCLEWSAERAYIIGADGSCVNVTRDHLPAALLERLR